ncbi:MAG: InlB B-repeat-containing protein [Clostridiales bacterium]|nr:InlB B-repeat-containing protein [Clostridiales bacterium]
MHMKKSFLAAVLAMILTITPAAPLQAALSPAPLSSEEKEASREEELLSSTEMNLETGAAAGHLTIPNTPTAPSLSNKKASAVYSISLNEDLPDTYVTENLPAIRQQNPYGTCWTFSCLALAEINMKLSEGISADLSELHLSYFSYQYIPDPLGGLEGDIVTFLDTSDNILNMGGNHIFAFNTLNTWKGAASEDTLPYSQSKEVISSGADPDLAYESTAHLKNVYRFRIKNDPQEAKKLIQQYGAVSISYYHDKNSFDKEHNSLYQANCKKTANHDVAIVGWDDSFPAENFVQTAPGDGAWLIRNSWGKDAECEQGYFWMSYYDTSIGAEAYALECVSQDSPEYYDNNYQYDGSIWSAYLEDVDIVVGANVFTVRNSREELKAVSIDTNSVLQDYKIEIYRNLTDPNDPSSGTLVNTTTGSLRFAGIYTIPLSDTVYLLQDDTYSVVVTLRKPGGKASLAQEDVLNLKNLLSAETSAKPGQSFLYFDEAWMDYGDYANANLRIKAFTNTIGFPETTLSQDSLSLHIGQETALRVNASGEEVPPDSVSWESSNPQIAEVSEDGIVTAVGLGTAEITASVYGTSHRCQIHSSVSRESLSILSMENQDVLLRWPSTDNALVRIYRKESGSAYQLLETVDGKKSHWIDSFPQTETFPRYQLEFVPVKEEKVCGQTFQNLSVQYSLAFEMNGGTASAEYPASYLGGTSIHVADPQKEGYEFIGWYTDPLLTQPLDHFSQPFGNLILYAGWKEETYTICFDGNGADSPDMDPMENLPKSGEYSLPENRYSRHGYTFMGWNTKPDGSGISVANEEVISLEGLTKDTKLYNDTLRLYAKWSPLSYTITYKMNGGTNSGKNPLSYQISSKTITLSAPTRKGYTFTGWYLDSSCTVQISQISQGSTGALKLYAGWEANRYTIRFEGNKATSGSTKAMKKCSYGKTYKLSANGFQRKGYVFFGWNTKANGKGTSYTNKAKIKSLSAKNGATVYLYATWKKLPPIK